MVREIDPAIGYATVARTLKLMVEAGISWIVDFNDGVQRFDHKYGCMRHDHIVCIECNNCIEVFNEELEDLKTGLAEKYGYEHVYTKLDIFGLCPNCRLKKQQREAREASQQTT